MPTKNNKQVKVVISAEMAKVLELIALRLNVSVGDALALAVGVLEQGSHDPNIKELLQLEQTTLSNYLC